ncbi:uncharacterized protein LOC110859586 [Folsomia candida]|uniref:uncharacterized protein LOC110859586 n=1 Tax=Folsomia candida TaxID=158441 RepID=UPI000B907358|nr:uncharacterized protein LOC110859586 [Folsomia candida]
MTCNPKWDEVMENLQPGQTPEFRPDLVARVFHIKLKELLNDICKRHILGTPVANVYVIEFQKRGLPHVHILLILKVDCKPKDPERVNKLVSAEIPDIEICPRLHAIVTRHMIHGPCGEDNLHSPCMANRKCTKKFPKQFHDETVIEGKSYPLYRRRNTGEITINNKKIDNRWVVPYNPALSLTYNCHLNVEGMIVLILQFVRRLLHHDEIKTYMDSRYVSAPEGAWRLFGFDMHAQSHSVCRLAVHLPGKHSISFNPDNIAAACQKNEEGLTTLTGWFHLNGITSAENQCLYADTPKHFVWDKQARKWKARQRGGEKTIGRMYSVSIASDPERYYLRLLLLHIKGATSFEDLRTIDGIICETFREAAERMGLLANDATWDNTLADAVLSSMPTQLRQLFAIICVFGSPPNVDQLWDKYKEYLYEDYSRHANHNSECEQCENLALRDIQDTLITHRKQCEDFGLRTPPANIPCNVEDYFDAIAEEELGAKMVESLNRAQKASFDQILDAMADETLQSRCFFLDGPGGSGKTYLYRTLLSTVRGQYEIALPVASTGIAANLLQGGRTYHSQFELPLNLDESSTSNMRLTSKEADVIRNAKILI